MISEDKLNEISAREYPYKFHNPIYDDEEKRCKDGLRNAFKSGFRRCESLCKYAIRYMMMNELYMSEKNDGGKVDFKYIDGFIKRLFKNIEEDIDNEG